MNEQIYAQAKAMLTHRNGTDREDMCLIDSKNGKIVGSQKHLTQLLTNTGVQIIFLISMMHSYRHLKITITNMAWNGARLYEKI